jgi:hypothetical protein
MVLEHRMIVSAIQLMKMDERDFGHMEWDVREECHGIIKIIFLVRTKSEAGTQVGRFEYLRSRTSISIAIYRNDMRRTEMKHEICKCEYYIAFP